MAAGGAKKLKKRKATAGTESSAADVAGASAGEAQATVGDADSDQQADVEQQARKKKKRKKAASSSGAAPTTVEEEAAATTVPAGGGAKAAAAGEADDIDKQLVEPRRKKKAASSAEAGGGGASGGADGSKLTETGKSASASRTVFVDGVPYVWSKEKVGQHFQNCGEILEVRAPTWQDSGRLRGYAHIVFATEAAWKKALKMDGESVGKKGRYLKIEPAKEEAQAAPIPAAQLEGQCRLFVKNLPYDVTESELGTLFGEHGKVKGVRVPTSFGRSKGFAYIEFAWPDGLKAAVTARPPPALRGRTLHLDVDAGSGPRAGFHYRAEAYESGFGPGRGGRKGSGKGGKGR